MDLFRIVTACGLALAVGLAIAAIDRWRERRYMAAPLATPVVTRVSSAVQRVRVAGSRARVAARRRDRAA
ncbi:MAG TPA: hypothetical protein VGU22_05075 [Methylomirabilota bacterium]|jgi:hypothetical protein|nr:hypothetical protein [Methylomirabilota bacterium]